MCRLIFISLDIHTFRAMSSETISREAYAAYNSEFNGSLKGLEFHEYLRFFKSFTGYEENDKV